MSNDRGFIDDLSEWYNDLDVLDSVSDVYEETAADAGKFWDENIAQPWDDLDVVEVWNNRPNQFAPSGRGTASIGDVANTILGDATEGILGFSPMAVVVILFVVFLTFRKVT